MCLKSQAIPDVPEEMVRVVRAVFPKGNLYIYLRDNLGAIYQDELFMDLYPNRGQPAYAPWRLALITVFQFLENLTDRQAADAVRSRLDWKYAISLVLTDPGFDHTVLSEFRTRLVALTAEERFLEAVIDLCKERGWFKVRGHQRTDSTHVLAEGARHELHRVCGRNTSPCPQCPGRCRARLAAQPGPARVVGAVWGSRR